MMLTEENILPGAQNSREVLYFTHNSTSTKRKGDENTNGKCFLPDLCFRAISSQTPANWSQSSRLPCSELVSLEVSWKMVVASLEKSLCFWQLWHSFYECHSGQASRVPCAIKGRQFVLFAAMELPAGELLKTLALRILEQRDLGMEPTVRRFDFAEYPRAPSSFVTVHLALTKPTGCLSLLLHRKLFSQSCSVCSPKWIVRLGVFYMVWRRPSDRPKNQYGKATSQWECLWGILLGAGRCFLRPGN